MRSFQNSPVQRNSDVLRTPLPCLLPLKNSPSQNSPLLFSSLPFPWYSPFEIPPTQVVPLDLVMVHLVSSLTSSKKTPLYTSPFSYLKIPLPFFLPFLKWPSYWLPLSYFTLPKPSNSPPTNEPSYSKNFLPLSNYTSIPSPSYSPALKQPLYLVPSFFWSSPLPSNLSFLKYPLYRLPSACLYSANPDFEPFSMDPVQVELSPNWILPWRKMPLRNSPLQVSFLMVNLP